MTNDQFDDFHNDGDSTPRHRKQGMSTGAKVAIVLGIVAGLCLLLCCGVGGYFWSKVRNSITVEPTEIAAIRDSMLSSIEMPADFNPKMGMDLTIAGQGMKMAVYGQGEGQQTKDGAILMLMQFPGGADAGQMQQQMEQNMGRETDIKVESTETKAVMIDGEEVNFQIVKGKTEEGDQDVRQVTGAISGKQGMVVLMLHVPEADYDEAAVTSMLESIKK